MKKSFWKETFHCIAVGILLFLSVTLDVKAAQTVSEDGQSAPDYIYGRPMTEDERAAVRSAVEDLAGNGGYLPLEEDEAVEESDEWTMWHMTQNLPSSYDAREEGIQTSVKTQRYGDCWAFSSLELLELNSIKRGLGTCSDLAERHLVYFAFHSVNGTPGQQDGEGTTYADNGNAAVCFRNGGKYEYAIRTLGSYVGAVEESAAPYEEAARTPILTPEYVYRNAEVRLHDASVLSTNDQIALKEAILAYGAVGITYYSGLEYYNYDTGAQYSPVDRKEDHAVVVVGWDDSYSRENFKDKPAIDGAWLVKNTWGTLFGRDGYFWLSYEDASIAANAYTMEAEADIYDNIYQCDNTLLDGVERADCRMSVANAYTLIGTGGCQEIPAAVNVAVPVGNVEYRIQLYKNPMQGNPESGEALMPNPVEGYWKYAGQHTVTLPNLNQQPAGTTIAVVVMLTGEKTGIYTDATAAGMRTRCSARGGENVSYYKNQDGWTDFGKNQNCNFRIKLLVKAGDSQATGEEITLTGEALTETYAEVSAYMQINAWEEAVSLLYQKLLQRQGEEAGIADWMERCRNGYTALSLMEGFLYSEEFTEHHPEVADARSDILRRCVQTEYRVGLEDVCGLYREALGREYDLPGLAYWAGQRAAGMSEEQIRMGFYQSEEYGRQH